MTAFLLLRLGVFFLAQGITCAHALFTISHSGSWIPQHSSYVGSQSIREDASALHCLDAS